MTNSGHWRGVAVAVLVAVRMIAVTLRFSVRLDGLGRMGGRNIAMVRRMPQGQFRRCVQSACSEIRAGWAEEEQEDDTV